MGTNMADFTDQKPRAATESDLKARWGGGKPGENFRCYLCGHKFALGEMWRWVFAKGKFINFMVCEKCDGPDVQERWAKQNEEAKTRFWWLRRG